MVQSFWFLLLLSGSVVVHSENVGFEVSTGQDGLMTVSLNGNVWFDEREGLSKVFIKKVMNQFNIIKFLLNNQAWRFLIL